MKRSLFALTTLVFTLIPTLAQAQLPRMVYRPIIREDHFSGRVTESSALLNETLNTIEQIKVDECVHAIELAEISYASFVRSNYTEDPKTYLEDVYTITQECYDENHVPIHYALESHADMHVKRKSMLNTIRD
jgi:hypothetical protein